MRHSRQASGVDLAGTRRACARRRRAQVNSRRPLADRPRASRSFSGPQALHHRVGDRLRIGRVGQQRGAPAVSGIAVVFEVTTGQPQAIASRIGSPKVSLKDG